MVNLDFQSQGYHSRTTMNKQQEESGAQKGALKEDKPEREGVIRGQAKAEPDQEGVLLGRALADWVEANVPRGWSRKYTTEQKEDEPWRTQVVLTGYSILENGVYHIDRWELVDSLRDGDVFLRVEDIEALMTPRSGKRRKVDK